VSVRRRAEPLTFVYPTSVAVEADGSLLVVENGAGRIWRVGPSTGVKTLVASNLSRPYDVVTTTSGEILVSNDNAVVRLVPGPPVAVASAPDQIGRIVTAPNGDLYFTTGATAYRLSSGAEQPVPVAQGLAAPHGLALTAAGALLIADTEHDRILRVDPSGAVTTFAQMNRPGDLAIARDGSVYACDALVGRIAHFSASGAALGFLGDFFDIPYAVAIAPSGGVYVAEAEASGHVKHVAPDGTVTTLSAH
jgi:glucose/arabinose dehydrogenase